MFQVLNVPTPSNRITTLLAALYVVGCAAEAELVGTPTDDAVARSSEAFKLAHIEELPAGAPSVLSELPRFGSQVGNPPVALLPDPSVALVLRRPPTETSQRQRGARSPGNEGSSIVFALGEQVEPKPTGFRARGSEIARRVLGSRSTTSTQQLLVLFPYYEKAHEASQSSTKPFGWEWKALSGELPKLVPTLQQLKFGGELRVVHADLTIAPRYVSTQSSQAQDTRPVEVTAPVAAPNPLTHRVIGLALDVRDPEGAQTLIRDMDGSWGAIKTWSLEQRISDIVKLANRYRRDSSQP